MSALWIDIKYTNLLAAKLDRFKIKKYSPYIAQCRCPICGDSKKNAFKARGFFFQKQQSIIYRCHNCGAGRTVKSFLEQIAPEYYSDYVAESYLEKERENPRPKLEPAPPVIAVQPHLRLGSPLKKLKKISQLSWNHPAKQYVVSRGIPNEQHARLFYCSKFATWTNSMIPDKLELKHDIPRLIIPFLDVDGRMFGYQGRSFDPNDKVRYISIMLEDHLKVFGLDKVDFNKKYYITEGPIDSMFLPNAIAMAGSDMNNPEFLNSNTVFVYDNEPRNKDIVKRIGAAINKGFNVCIWPESLKHKDINDMIMSGLSEKNIVDIIDSNTYNGLTAMLKFTEWKKTCLIEKNNMKKV